MLTLIELQCMVNKYDITFPFWMVKDKKLYWVKYITFTLFELLFEQLKLYLPFKSLIIQQGCIFILFFSFDQRILKNEIMVSIKILTSTTVFKTDNNQKFISILEWFLWDHVTLNTGEMASENSGFHHRIFILLYY